MPYVLIGEWFCSEALSLKIQAFFCRLGGCNLSLKSFPLIVNHVSSLHLPLLILGGGGYNEMATVKAWVACTAAACDAVLPDTVPLHDFYADYGPTFCFQHVRDRLFALHPLAALCPF
jgi:hypothetical protein